MVTNAETSAYHARTTANIAKIFGDGGEEQMQRVLSLPSSPLAEGLLQRLNPSLYKGERDSLR